MNILQKLFPKKYATGAFEDAPDTRQVILSAVQAPIMRPRKNITDLSMIPVFNQGWLGTCVAHALTEYKMWLDYKETGVVKIYSRRWFYALVRFVGKMTDAMGQGLFPRDGVKTMVNVGIIKDKGIDDNTLTHEKYINIKPTDAERAEANTLRAKSYASVLQDREGLLQALYQNGLVAASMPYSPSSWISGLLSKFFSYISRHYVLLYGYEELDNGDVKIYFRNSWDTWWGFGGNGEFLWSEYGNQINDMYVLIDLQNDVVQRAKDSRYIFLRDLSIGMRGDDVRKLQERFIQLGIFIDQPTSYFGVVTKDCVMQYQRMRGLPETGYLGPLSRTMMNADNLADTKQASKLDLWTEAIKQHEGWFTGSVSYRNNNPGNLRYANQAGTVGKDKNNFAVFSSYAAGYMALQKLLLRAATGLSTTYRSTMTLLEFFSVYAPALDNNNPRLYAETVAKKIGVPVTTMIKDLV